MRKKINNKPLGYTLTNDGHKQGTSANINGKGQNGQVMAAWHCNGDCLPTETCYCWEGYHQTGNDGGGWYGVQHHETRQCDCVQTSFLE